jgi:uncharacterized membrane protein
VWPAWEVEVSSGALFLAVFLACAVEAVEALTIVLAAGTARDWRSAVRESSVPWWCWR